MIDDELTTIIKTGDDTRASMQQKINKLEHQIHALRLDLHKYDKDAEKPKDKKDCGTQLNLVELGIEKMPDLISQVHECPNMFLSGGRVHSVEWTFILISDILSSKMKADFIDSKNL